MEVATETVTKKSSTEVEMQVASSSSAPSIPNVAYRKFDNMPKLISTCPFVPITALMRLLVSLRKIDLNDIPPGVKRFRRISQIFIQPPPLFSVEIHGFPCHITSMSIKVLSQMIYQIFVNIQMHYIILRMKKMWKECAVMRENLCVQL